MIEQPAPPAGLRSEGHQGSSGSDVHCNPPGQLPQDTDLERVEVTPDGSASVKQRRLAVRRR